MKKFLIKTLLSATLLLVVIVGVNGTAIYIYNSGDIERNMVTHITQGTYVTNLKVYNDRLFQKMMIQQMDTLPCQVVFGSSRTMQITSDFFPDASFYNSSVFGGYLEDIMGVYLCYEQANIPISKAIIGIDPWIFRGGDFAFLASYPIYDQYVAMCAKIGTTPRYHSIWFYAADYLLSLSNWWSNTSRIVSSFDTSFFLPTADSLNKNETEYCDGSYSLSEQERNQTREELSSIDVSQHLNTNSIKLDESQINEFKCFVRYLKKRGIEVILLFSPMHPLTYQATQATDKVALETERLVREFARQNQIEVKGAYDPDLYNLDVLDFLNGGHPKRDVFYPIFGLH